MEQMSDEQLIELHKNGDITAFEKLYARYTKLVNSFSRSFYLAGGDEDDVKQEAMLGLFTAINTFDKTKGKFSTFAYMCIKSRVINAVNLSVTDKHRALNNSVPISDFDFEIEQSSSFLPENIIIGSENLNELINKIKSLLSPFEIQVFNSYINGANYREIALELDVSTKRVDNALQRIKDKSKKFRSKLCRI